jgi:hypothetical protein
MFFVANCLFAYMSALTHVCSLWDAKRSLAQADEIVFIGFPLIRTWRCLTLHCSISIKSFSSGKDAHFFLDNYATDSLLTGTYHSML